MGDGCRTITWNPLNPKGNKKKIKR